jgi:energy-coupling factor transporter ATP-binding protein EcfA2
MSESLVTLLKQLEAVASYQGPWLPLRAELPLLDARLHELRERETRLDDLLVVVLAGGSGVGKSTLLNAIAGDTLAETSEFRPCTSLPTVYHPPGARLNLPEWRTVPGSALEQLVIIDTPDSDTVVRDHRETVQQALALCDLVLLCGSPEKYLDEATWSLLRPLRGERTMVCVETKAYENVPSVRDHWLAHLREQGFQVDGYFRVNALRTLDRKLTGDPRDGEFDFPGLERFLQEELNRERIGRIKRSNAVGLLRKTISVLHQRIGQRATALDAVRQRIDSVELELRQQTQAAIDERLFAEPHLWNYALGREMNLRAKGFMGTLFRFVETIRTLPVRLTGRLWIGRRGFGRQAASALANESLFQEDVDVVSETIEAAYSTKRSDVNLAMARAGFAPLSDDEGLERFRKALREGVTAVLRGPVRERLTAKARILCSWPATLIGDAPVLAFLAFAAYRIVSDYLRGGVLQPGVLSVPLVVIIIIVGVELLVLSLLARLAAWAVRRGARRDLGLALTAQEAAFLPERRAVQEALEAARIIEELYAANVGDSTEKGV